MTNFKLPAKVGKKVYFYLDGKIESGIAKEYVLEKGLTFSKGKRMSQILSMIKFLEDEISSKASKLIGFMGIEKRFEYYYNITATIEKSDGITIAVPLHKTAGTKKAINTIITSNNCEADIEIALLSDEGLCTVNYDIPELKLGADSDSIDFVVGISITIEDNSIAIHKATADYKNGYYYMK